MNATTRQRVISSLVAMFNAEHNNSEAPAWLLTLHHTSDDATLLARLANWKQNYPQHFASHGLYVM
jgi:ferric-dicitrate binding protein FerR (iron transport regulator)